MNIQTIYFIKRILLERTVSGLRNTVPQGSFILLGITSNDKEKKHISLGLHTQTQKREIKNKHKKGDGGYQKLMEENNFQIRQSESAP